MMTLAYSLKNDWTPADTIARGLPTVENTTEGWDAFFATLFNAFIVLGTTIAVIVIIIAAFHMITSQGVDAKLEKGKKIILWAIIGLVVMFFAYSIVNVILRTPFTAPNRDLPAPLEGTAFPTTPAAPAPDPTTP